jgi:hypothetical protein
VRKVQIMKFRVIGIYFPGSSVITSLQGPNILPNKALSLGR